MSSISQERYYRGVRAMATAVFIKSESADYYLYCFEEDLTDADALNKVEELCDEEREYWVNIMITHSE